MKKYLAVICTSTNEVIAKEGVAENAWDMLENAVHNMADSEEVFKSTIHPISLPNNPEVSKIRVYEISGKVREFKVKTL